MGGFKKKGPRHKIGNLTKHGKTRLADRMRISKRRAETQADMAKRRGVKYEFTKDKLRDYISWRTYKRKEVCGYQDFYIYNNYLFIFVDGNLVTAWELPDELKNPEFIDIKQITKNKKKPFTRDILQPYLAKIRAQNGADGAKPSTKKAKKSKTFVNPTTKETVSKSLGTSKPSTVNNEYTDFSFVNEINFKKPVDDNKYTKELVNVLENDEYLWDHVACPIRFAIENVLSHGELLEVYKFAQKNNIDTSYIFRYWFKFAAKLTKRLAKELDEVHFPYSMIKKIEKAAYAAIFFSYDKDIEEYATRTCDIDNIKEYTGEEAFIFPNYYSVKYWREYFNINFDFYKYKSGYRKIKHYCKPPELEALLGGYDF